MVRKLTLINVYCYCYFRNSDVRNEDDKKTYFVRAERAKFIKIASIFHQDKTKLAVSYSLRWCLHVLILLYIIFREFCDCEFFFINELGKRMRMALIFRKTFWIFWISLFLRWMQFGKWEYKYIGDKKIGERSEPNFFFKKNG